MTFKQIAENLRTTGRKFRWGRMELVYWGDKDPAYCALGIKATEFGVPIVVLAYAQTEDSIARYVDFGLKAVYEANDHADNYERLLEALDAIDNEGNYSNPDIEGWVEYLKSLEPKAIAWATEKGYHSLLTQPGGGA